MLRESLVYPAALMLFGCSQPSSDSISIRSMDEGRQVAYFRSLALNRQIQVYVESMRDIKPRPIHFAVELAMGGRPNAEAVAEKIQTDSNIRDKSNLLLILKSMQDMGKYNVCNDGKIMKKIVPSNDIPASEQDWKLKYSLDLIDMCLTSASDD